MLPALSISTSGSDSSRWLSAATEAENSSPFAGADGREVSPASVRISSLPVYVTGTAAAKGQASTRYVPDASRVPMTVSTLRAPVARADDRAAGTEHREDLVVQGVAPRDAEGEGCVQRVVEARAAR